MSDRVWWNCGDCGSQASTGTGINLIICNCGTLMLPDLPGIRLVAVPWRPRED